MARAQATESTRSSPPRPPGLGSQTRPPLTRSLAVRPRDMLTLRGLDTRPPKDVVKLFGVQLFSGAARHQTERCSGSGGLLGDLIPHLKSSGDFGAMIGGSHTAPRWAAVRGNPTERGQKPLR